MPNASPVAGTSAPVVMAALQPMNTRTKVPSASAATFWTVVEVSAMVAA